MKGYNLSSFYVEHPKVKKRKKRTINNVKICSCRGAVWVFIEEADAIIGALPNPRIQRDASKELYTRLLCQSAGATRGGFEYPRLRFAVWAHKSSHILYKANDSHPNLSAKVDLTPDVLQGDFLRGGDQDSTVDGRFLKVLDDTEVLVRGTRRGVDNEPVEISPVYILQELSYQPVLLRTAPHYGV